MDAQRLSALVPALLAAPVLAFAQADVPGGKDHPLFTRMPGYYLEWVDQKDFDVFKDFRAGGGKVISVEGRMHVARYRLKRGEKSPGNAAIIRNFTNAAKQIGGVVLAEDSANAFLRIDQGDRRTWVIVYAIGGGDQYQLRIVEEAALEHVVVADAAALARQLGAAGRVVAHGIYFDVDQAVVKPESKPALDEIAALLKQQPQLSLFVVGHTDGAGAFDHNMQLSAARARAVVDALVAGYGIDRRRLMPHGVGPLAPVAPNETDEGRRRNRRVELVVSR